MSLGVAILSCLKIKRLVVSSVAPEQQDAAEQPDDTHHSDRGSHAAAAANETSHTRSNGTW